MARLELSVQVYSPLSLARSAVILRTDTFPELVILVLAELATSRPLGSRQDRGEPSPLQMNCAVVWACSDGGTITKRGERGRVRRIHYNTLVQLTYGRREKRHCKMHDDLEKSVKTHFFLLTSLLR